MANNAEWESTIRGLEEIEYASLSSDEQSELIMGLPNIILHAQKDIISGEFTDRKLHRRLFRVVGSLQRQMDSAHKVDRDRKPSIGIRKILAKPRWLRP